MSSSLYHGPIPHGACGVHVHVGPAWGEYACIWNLLVSTYPRAAPLNDISQMHLAGIDITDASVRHIHHYTTIAVIRIRFGYSH